MSVNIKASGTVRCYLTKPKHYNVRSHYIPEAVSVTEAFAIKTFQEENPFISEDPTLSVTHPE